MSSDKSLRVGSIVNYRTTKNMVEEAALVTRVHPGGVIDLKIFRGVLPPLDLKSVREGKDVGCWERKKL